MKKILIVGAGGQIGSELTTYLRGIYGNNNVIASDMRVNPVLAANGPFEELNALDIPAYAAIVSSLASMMNSISSIFTMDIYKSYINKGASDTHMVTVGRITSVVALVIACVVAPLLGNLDQAFQFIQEFTGFVSPGALAIFLAGFFYKRATANGALAAALGTFVFSVLFKFLIPGVPFMDRMMIVFALCFLVIVLFALLEKKPIEQEKVVYPKGLFKTSTGFKVCAVAIIAILAFLYIIWW